MEIYPLIQKITSGTNLEFDDAKLVFDSMLEGNSSDVDIETFLIALSKKGESAQEIRALIDSMRKHATRIYPKTSRPIIDTCGTGGDSFHSFNISTAAAIVASAAGATIAKHGNRSASGICGSADFMEEAGFNLNCEPLLVKESIEAIGIGFLFAPKFHPLMRNVANARKRIRVRTIFNIAGPLSNPCEGITGQVIGVYRNAPIDVISEVGSQLISNLMIISSDDGMDELSTSADNHIIWIQNGEVRKYRLNAMELGLRRAKQPELAVASKEESVGRTLNVIYGNANKNQEDIVVLNSAAALVVSNLCETFEEGIARSREAISGGKARKRLIDLVSKCGDPEKLRATEEKYLS